MTDAGDATPTIDQAIVERLRAHAERVVGAAAVPRWQRPELIEELVSHLVERTRDAMATGSSDADAVDEAISAFGGIDELATDLSAAFHSRLWASTIGVLLPAVAIRNDRPVVIGWLRFLLVIGVAVSVIGIAIAAWFATPVHALLIVGFLVLGIVGLVLAFRGLVRGQAWALWYAIAFTVELVAYGIGSVVAPEEPGTATIPVGAILAASVLLGVWMCREELREYVAASRPISRGLAALLLVTFLGSALAVPVTAVVADPTQAGARDLKLVVSVACDRGEVAEPGFPTRFDVQRITIVADMTWRRSDVLPTGLDGLVNPTHYGDTVGFRLVDDTTNEAVGEWYVVHPTDALVVDTASGTLAGWWGSTSPSAALIPETQATYTAVIDPDAIRAGRTLRATWPLAPSREGEVSWPTVEVAYAHLDRFLLLATAGCGERSVGHQVPIPTDGHSTPDGTFP
jgi:hypothetical protein